MSECEHMEVARRLALTMLPGETPLQPTGPVVPYWQCEDCDQEFVPAERLEELERVLASLQGEANAGGSLDGPHG